jgi:hypothetical protein
MKVVSLSNGKKNHTVRKHPGELEYGLYGRTDCGQYFEEEEITGEVSSKEEIEEYCSNCAGKPPGWR